MIETSPTQEKAAFWRKRWLWQGAGAVLAAAALFLVWLLPLESWPSLCTTRRITGVPCPSCGMGRSLHALLHGNLSESLRYHPLVALYAAAGLLWASINTALKARTGRGLPAAAALVAVVTGTGLLFAVWAFRLATGRIP